MRARPALRPGCRRRHLARAVYSWLGPRHDGVGRVLTNSVRVYLGTELIKTHLRVAQGKRSTDPSDYPESKADYALRSVEALLSRARQRGAHVGLYAEKLLGGPLPWTRMRQAYALVRLCDTYGNGRVEAICQSALAFGVVDVTRIGRMLKAAVAPSVAEPRTAKVVPLVTPRFARSTEHFGTLPQRKEGT